MKILITGNHGYIGRVLTANLISKHDIIGVDCDYFPPNKVFGRFDAYEASNKVKTYKIDIRSTDKLAHLLKDIDAVVHLAALPNDFAANLAPEMTNKINFLATKELAVIAKSAGVKKLIFASSCSVYGAKGDELINEEDEPNPLTPYAWSKYRSEQALMALADKDFTVTCMRNATCFGVSPRMRFDMVVHNITGYGYLEKEIRLRGDGSAWRALVHIEDLSQAYSLALRDGITGIYSIVGENYRIIDLGKEIAEMLGMKMSIMLPDKDARSYKVDGSKAEQELGYKPRITVKDGIKEVYDLYVSKPLTSEEFNQPYYWAEKQFKYLMENNLVDIDLYKR